MGYPVHYCQRGSTAILIGLEGRSLADNHCRSPLDVGEINRDRFESQQHLSLAFSSRSWLDR
jgi:hypothetical protein